MIIVIHKGVRPCTKINQQKNYNNIFFNMKVNTTSLFFPLFISNRKNSMKITKFLPERENM